MYDSFRYKRTARQLREEIQSNVISQIDTQSWEDVDTCPQHCLCHNMTKEKLFWIIYGFSDGTLRNDTVYVLECKHRYGDQRRIAHEELQIQNPWWITAAQKSKRLIYVGFSQQVLQRLFQHVAGRGRGANFTQIFRLRDSSLFNGTTTRSKDGEQR